MEILIIIIILLILLHFLNKTNYICESYTESYIPIFIIVHDRLNFLRKCINSLKYIKSKYKIILYDVASTYKPTLEFLEKMKNKGIAVYRSEVNNYKTVGSIIKKYLIEHPQCKYYVLTDHDIELDNVRSDILEYYIWLLNKYNVTKVGCSLRLNDIPDSYPKKNKGGHGNKGVIDWESKFWLNPVKATWKNRSNTIYFNQLDTTFSLYHRDYINPVSSNAIRTDSPYSARHLDWYVNKDNITEDHIYYNKNNNASHWN
jgi:hypothetical protein